MMYLIVCTEVLIRVTSLPPFSQYERKTAHDYEIKYIFF